MASTDGAPASQLEHEAQEELRLRVQRFARLRSAQRALQPSVIALQDEESTEQSGQMLRNELQRLSEQMSGNPTGDDLAVLSEAMVDVDRGLDAFADFLRTCSDGIAPAQLRSTIPPLAVRHRREVISFLELLLEDRVALEGRLSTVEYLITLLCTEDVGGRRTVAHDPATLTPLLSELGAELEASASGDSSDLEREFFQAAGGDYPDSEVALVLRRLRERKQELGIHWLAAGPLRAVITYNARMFNRMFDDLEASRASDHDFEGDLLKLASEPEADAEEDLGDIELPSLVESVLAEVAADEAAGQAVVEVPPAPEPAREWGSVFDCVGLVTLEAALRKRIETGTLAGDSVAERVALALDLSVVEKAERDALLSENGADELQQLLIKTAMVGLLVKDQAAYEKSLPVLGIDSEELYRGWVRELDKLLKKRVNELVAGDGFDDATRLSEVKTRYLFAPINRLNREDAARRQRNANVESLDMQDAARDAQRSLFQRVAGVIGWKFVDDVPIWHQPGQLILATVGALLVLALVTTNLVSHRPSELMELRPRDLLDASPYLAAGQRNGQGEGRRIIGELDPEYQDLEPIHQWRAAMEMAQNLRAKGVMDLMVYDDKKQLLVHYAGGQLRLPKRPAGYVD